MINFITRTYELGLYGPLENEKITNLNIIHVATFYGELFRNIVLLATPCLTNTYINIIVYRISGFFEGYKFHNFREFTGYL